MLTHHYGRIVAAVGPAANGSTFTTTPTPTTTHVPRVQRMKTLARSLATLLIAPLLLTHWIGRRITDADRSLESHSQFLALLPGSTGSFLRVAFYRRALQACHPTATIAFGTLFSKVDARLGPHIYIGPRCCLGLVTLEADVLLGPGVQIPSGPQTHGIERLDIPIRQQTGQRVRITIGPDSWIGAGSVVLADVGQQTVVGAGSIVTKPLPDRVIAVGNPARVIASRRSNNESIA